MPLKVYAPKHEFERFLFKLMLFSYLYFFFIAMNSW